MTSHIKPENSEKCDYKYTRVEQQIYSWNRTQSRKKGDSGHQKKNHYRFYTILENYHYHKIS